MSSSVSSVSESAGWTEVRDTGGNSGSSFAQDTMSGTQVSIADKVASGFSFLRVIKDIGQEPVRGCVFG